VVQALAGKRQVENLDDNLCTGIIETRTVPAAIHAADSGIKGAEVTLMEMRLADGLGGKGIVFFTGLVADVEAALEIVDETLTEDQQIRQVIIPQLHPDLANVLEINSRFGMQLAWQFYGVKNIRLDG
jgi:microcompartment protein CcmL/EutN